jgi:hypothetical protein
VVTQPEPKNKRLLALTTSALALGVAAIAYGQMLGAFLLPMCDSYAARPTQLAARCAWPTRWIWIGVSFILFGTFMLVMRGTRIWQRKAAPSKPRP